MFGTIFNASDVSLSKSNNCSDCHLQTYDFQVLPTNLAESLMLMPKCPGMKLEKSIILKINGFQFLQVCEFWQKSNEFAIRTIEDQFLRIYIFLQFSSESPSSQRSMLC